MARLSRITGPGLPHQVTQRGDRRQPQFADLLALSLDEQAVLDGFENRSPNGRPLGAPLFIADAEGTRGRIVRPGERSEAIQRSRRLLIRRFVRNRTPRHRGARFCGSGPV